MAVVSFRRVEVRFDASLVLDDINLEITAGERVALVGPSGAGKSTLLRVCNGLVVPSSGDVCVLGRHLRARRTRELQLVRRQIGTIAQHLDLVGPLRVVHNVNAGRLAAWGPARSLRSLVRPLEVDTARSALTRIGIGDKLFERTDRLSGGEQQRVALARVLMQRPELILADEPISSLDPAHGEEVMDLLTTVVTDAHRTLLVSVHDIDVARRRCDRIVGMRSGRIVFDLPSADVPDHFIARLYRLRR